MKLFKWQIDVAKNIQLGISLFIRVSLLFAIIGAAINQKWTVAFISALTLFLTFLPAIIERNMKIYLPLEFEFVMTTFIYGGLYIGEFKNLYIKLWWYDIFLHWFSGVALGFIGFLILYVMYYEGKIKASPVTIAMFSFCFALALGAIWEIIEFTIDSHFGTNMQRSGLVDTMGDLIVDCIGALFTSIVGYSYIKWQRKGLGIFDYLVKKFIKENPRLFK